MVQFSERERARLEPLLDRISSDERFEFVRQLMGYYYYVEVWKYNRMGVVFEEADLAQLEAVKRREPHIIHELIFHPNACLAATYRGTVFWDRLTTEAIGAF